MELHAGIQSPVFSQNRRQPGQHSRAHEADFKHTNLAARDAAHRFQIFIDFVQSTAGAIHQSFAGGRQLYGARSAQKQGISDFFFEASDLLRERWLSHVEALGCMAEMQFFGDGQEVAEVAEVHIRIVLIETNNILDVSIGFV